MRVTNNKDIFYGFWAVGNVGCNACPMCFRCFMLFVQSSPRFVRRYTCSADSNRLYDYTCLADGNILSLFGLFPQIHIPCVKFQTRPYSKIVISKVNLSLVRSDAESTSVCLMCPFDILAFDIPSTGRGQVKPCGHS